MFVGISELLGLLSLFATPWNNITNQDVLDNNHPVLQPPAYFAQLSPHWAMGLSKGIPLIYPISYLKFQTRLHLMSVYLLYMC